MPLAAALCSFILYLYIFGLLHAKTSSAYADNEDPDHPRSPIRVFAVR